MSKYRISLMSGSVRTIEADSYEEKPAGFITFWSDEIGQVLTIRKTEVDQIEHESSA